MQLPEKYSDNYRIDHDRDTVNVGDVVYYAPDGVIHCITDSSSHSFELLDTWQNEHWKTSKEDIQENLYSDYFPVKLTGYYPE